MEEDLHGRGIGVSLGEGKVEITIRIQACDD